MERIPADVLESLILMVSSMTSLTLIVHSSSIFAPVYASMAIRSARASAERT